MSPNGFKILYDVSSTEIQIFLSKEKIDNELENVTLKNYLWFHGI